MLSTALHQEVPLPPTSRRAFVAVAVAVAVTATIGCQNPDSDLPFEGKWNNSRSGREGLWLYISKSTTNSYLIREAVGRDDNFGRSSTARVVGGRLVYDDDHGFKELIFLDKSFNILITVNSVVREIQFYRQS